MLLQNSVHTKYEASNYAPNDKKDLQYMYPQHRRLVCWRPDREPQ